jgi:hypothetical protein
VVHVLIGILLVVVVVGGPLALVGYLVRRSRRAGANQPPR